ncbi:MAG: hypothetical protein ABSG95_02740 [Solirubrobacteraceae bacterium]|jgi:hypothetical protein
MNARSALAPDAAMVLGIAATAMPFARSPDAEAERWLRVLRLHGEVGAVLQSLGVSEMPLPAPAAGAGGDGDGAGPQGREDRDVIAHVSRRAAEIARERGAAGISTTDLLMAVMHVYGGDFDRVLQAHGTDRDEVIERLGSRAHEAAEG